MLTVNSTINLAGQAVPNIIPAVQGDTGRVIVFTLADFTIPSGSTATYYVQKPSGEAVYNAATINDNKVTVELTAQSLAETGDNYGQVRILNGEDVVTSFDFILLVKPFRGIDAIESTTEMNIFDEAVQNAMEQFDSMLPDIIAPEFDSSTAYAAGDYVIYSGKLYQFTSAHSGAWTGTDAEETMVTEKLGGGSGDGLTEDIKQALLQIAEKVVYIDEHGQDYYDALYDAFYPPAEVVSISAVYTQSGTVYDTDTLDSLKDDLVVTATYSDQTTAVVATYTLSGTLAVGTSTITVTYGGKTTTFDVTVSDKYLYSWDLTQSLTDTIGGVTATAPSGVTLTENGAYFDNRNARYIIFPNVIENDITIEIDVYNMDFQASGTQNGRFIMFITDSSTTGADQGVILRSGSSWSTYFGSWGSNSQTFTNINAFSGKTVVIKINSEGQYSFYCDDTLIFQPRTPASNFKSLVLSSNTYGYVKMTVSAVRIYSGGE